MPSGPTYQSIPGSPDEQPTPSPALFPNRSFRAPPRRLVVLGILALLTVGLVVTRTDHPRFLQRFTSFYSDKTYNTVQSTTKSQYGSRYCPCPLIYSPVCCRTAFGTFTAGNSCQCKCRRGNVLYPWPCRGQRPAQKPGYPGQRQCYCTMEYRPVCCSSYFGRSTAPNKCFCKCRPGGTVVLPMPCPQKPEPHKPEPQKPKPQVPEQKVCKCPRILRPVCCETDHGDVTKNNACLCKCDDKDNKIKHLGACHQTPPTKPPPVCPCPKILAPVCCTTDEGDVTVDNACLCKCDKSNSIKHDGECKKPCICTLNFDPVCCETKEGDKTTSNECFCTCDPENSVKHKGECKQKPVTPQKPNPPQKPHPPKQCPCPKILKPVCCATEDGDKTVDNACICTCDKENSVLHEGECKKVCPCPAIYDPVCCATKKGDVTTPNSCSCKCDPDNSVKYKGECKKPQQETAPPPKH